MKPRNGEHQPEQDQHAASENPIKIRRHAQRAHQETQRQRCQCKRADEPNDQPDRPRPALLRTRTENDRQ